MWKPWMNLLRDNLPWKFALFCLVQIFEAKVNINSKHALEDWKSVSINLFTSEKIWKQTNKISPSLSWSLVCACQGSKPRGAFLISSRGNVLSESSVLLVGRMSICVSSL